MCVTVFGGLKLARQKWKRRKIKTFFQTVCVAVLANEYKFTRTTRNLYTKYQNIFEKCGRNSLGGLWASDRATFGNKHALRLFLWKLLLNIHFLRSRRSHGQTDDRQTSDRPAIDPEWNVCICILYIVGNASLYLLHTFKESSIPFYSTNNMYT